MWKTNTKDPGNPLTTQETPEQVREHVKLTEKNHSLPKKYSKPGNHHTLKATETGKKQTARAKVSGLSILSELHLFGVSVARKGWRRNALSILSELHLGRDRCESWCDTRRRLSILSELHHTGGLYPDVSSIIIFQFFLSCILGGGAFTVTVVVLAFNSF